MTRMNGKFVQDRADVVYGNRFHGKNHRALYFWHSVGNALLTLACIMLTNLNLEDMEVGYKVFRTDVLRRIRLRSDRFGFEPEVRVKVAELGCRIFEVPIAYYGRTYAEGKKITWQDGIAALWWGVSFVTDSLIERAPLRRNPPQVHTLDDTSRETPS